VAVPGSAWVAHAPPEEEEISSDRPDVLSAKTSGCGLPEDGTKLLASSVPPGATAVAEISSTVQPEPVASWLTSATWPARSTKKAAAALPSAGELTAASEVAGAVAMLDGTAVLCHCPAS
jgi:hypothetical protein